MNQLLPRFDKSLVKIQHYQYYIGIDVGTNTGFAVWCKQDKNFYHLETLMIHQALLKVSNLNQYFVGEIFVRVEDARQVKYGTDPVKAQGAGSIKRDASIWEDFLIDMGIPFEMVRPNPRITKLPADKFKMITGYKGSTTSHARDAGMLVFGI